MKVEQKRDLKKEASLASGSISIYLFLNNNLNRLYRELLSDPPIGIENTQEDVRKVMGLSSAELHSPTK